MPDAKAQKMKAGMKRRGLIKRAAALGMVGVIAANINLSVLSNVLKNKADKAFSRLTGRTELVQKETKAERPSIRGIFGPTSAWAKKITPKMIKGWFKNRKEPRTKRLSDGTPVAPFRKEYVAVRNGHICWLAKDGSEGLAFTVGKAAGRGKGKYDPKFQKALKRLGISKLDDDKVSIFYAGKRTERGEKAWYYYIIQPRMRGVILLKMTAERHGITASPTSYPITKDSDMIILPNNRCALATQNEVLILTPRGGRKLDIGRYSLNEGIEEEGAPPVNPKLTYYSEGKDILVALKADNWRHIWLFDLTTGETGTVLASR